MPARRQPTLIEILIVVSIMGILAAIIIPAIVQARQPAAESSAEQESKGPPPTPDGLLNTIEVSELSERADTERFRPEDLLKPLAPLIPVLVVFFVGIVLFAKLRRRLGRRAD